MSEAFANASSSILGLDHVEFNVATDEAARPKQCLVNLQKEIRGTDELAQPVELLNGTDTTLGEAQLR